VDSSYHSVGLFVDLESRFAVNVL